MEKEQEEERKKKEYAEQVCVTSLQTCRRKLILLFRCKEKEIINVRVVHVSSLD